MTAKIKLISAVLGALLLAGSSALLFAQAHRAIVLGRVLDSSGAVIPGVDVKVIHKSTNVVRSTITNNNGNYEVPGLFPGSYRIEASLAGFKTSIVEDVPVESGQRAEVNHTLQLGAITDSVTVTSGTEILDRANADVNTVISQEKLSDLPIGQGNATWMFVTVPGSMTADTVGIGGNGSDVQPIQRGGSNQIRFNGAPDGTTEYTINGDPNTQSGNTGAGGGVSLNLTTDVVQEVRVQTNSFDASIGHTGGATIDLVMKQGTNDYHGTAFTKFRRAGWNANGFTQNRTGTPRQNNEFEQYGFTGGGPVWLGRLYNGKDKTFFYYGYEVWHGRVLNPPTVATVPRPEHLKGDFSDLLRLGPQYQLYDPATGRLMADGRIQRDPFPNNIIPANRINPISVTMNQLWASPNLPGTLDGQDNYSFDFSPWQRGFKNSTVRLDHNLSLSHKLSGKWLFGRTEVPGNAPLDISPSGFFVKNFNIGISDVWSVSPTLVADFRFSDNRGGITTAARGGSFPLGNPITFEEVGFGYLEGLFDTSNSGYPSVALPEYEGRGIGLRNGAASRAVSEIRTAASNWTKMHGNHSFKFGVDFRDYIENSGTSELLSINYSNAYTTGPFSTSAPPQFAGTLAAHLLGTFSSASVSQRVQPANLSSSLGLYLNDDWKLSPRLTLNLGLRYEREGPSTERYDQAVGDFAFDIDNPIAAQAKAAYALNPIPEIPVSQFEVKGGILFAGKDTPRAVYDADNNNFAPRIGLAYQVASSTVLRAGYGIFYIPYNQRFYAAAGSVPGFDTNTFSFATLDGGLTFPNTLQDLFSTGLATPIGSSLGLRTFLGQAFALPQLPRAKPNAYSQRWQFGVQHVFANSYKLEVRYVGNRTLKMPLAKNINAVPNRYLSSAPERDQATINRLSRLVPNPFVGIPGVEGNLGTNTLISAATLLQPFPEFSSITMQLNQGRTWYDALQIEFEKRLSHGLTFQTSYTFSKTIDQLGYLNPADEIPERVVGYQTRPHMWRLMGIYEFPFGRGKAFGSNLAPAWDWLIGGWQAQGITYVQSGTPIPFQNSIYRGDIKNLAVDDPVRERLFNTDGFERDPAKQLASNVRNFPSRFAGVRYPHFSTTDFSLIKGFRVTEQFKLEIRAEAYNVFNDHFYNDNAGYAYGVPSAADTNPLSQNFGATQVASIGRVIQGVLRLTF